MLPVSEDFLQCRGITGIVEIYAESILSEVEKCFEKDIA
jgi:hypothetical protein